MTRARSLMIAVACMVGVGCTAASPPGRLGSGGDAEPDGPEAPSASDPMGVAGSDRSGSPGASSEPWESIPSVSDAGAWDTPSDAGAWDTPSDAGAWDTPSDAGAWDTPANDPGPGSVDTFFGGTPVGDTASAEPAFAQLHERLAHTAGLDADRLAENHPTGAVSELGYAPREAANLDLIQESYSALDAAELAVLDDHGFVISARRSVPSFGYGYAALYAEDLPLYVSIDSVLEAVRRSYDDMLEVIELHSLIPELSALLDGMRERLATDPPPGLSSRMRQDLDFYLAVAADLLWVGAAPPVAGAEASEIADFVRDAEAAGGWSTRELFGARRHIDFSQFQPRGHYTNSESLERYFRAMMWLGRIDLRMIETDQVGEAVFYRRQLEAALALYGLMDETLVEHWRNIDQVIENFVGVSDYMRVPDVASLMSDLGATTLADIAELGDQQIIDTLINGDYGAQKISSHIMVHGLANETLPLNRSFLMFGQRYVVDSHVLSNVVYDRLLSRDEAPRRMLPDPLDVAYTVFGNNHAAMLLREELETYDYAPELESMRILVDEHGEEFWDQNLYNLRLATARGMSPSPDDSRDGLPSVMATGAWHSRLTSSQLASWAELRHDAILYAKQSFTGGAVCEYPDAMVDPYPAAWAALERFARRGQALIDELPLDGSPDVRDRMRDYFLQMEGIIGPLRGMAEAVRAGTPFTEAQMAFINQAVQLEGDCGWPPNLTGWFARLYYNSEAAAVQDPIVADVHTQPTDEAGNPVGRVLHVGTGLPRLMVVTANTCNGPKAYAGFVSAYHEHVTRGFDRLTDDRWSALLESDPPPEVPWMESVVVSSE